MEASSSASINYCKNHPDRETNLRCNNCGKLICPDCAVRTPTGYRCEECVHGHQKKFDTAQISDYIFAASTAAILAYIGSRFVSVLGFFTIFLAPAAGTLIAEAVRMFIKKRRSKLLFQITTWAVVAGSLPIMISLVFFMFIGGGFGSLYALLWQGVYTFLAASAAYYRLTGIRIGR